MAGLRKVACPGSLEEAGSRIIHVIILHLDCPFASPLASRKPTETSCSAKKLNIVIVTAALIMLEVFGTELSYRGSTVTVSGMSRG